MPIARPSGRLVAALLALATALVALAGSALPAAGATASSDPGAPPPATPDSRIIGGVEAPSGAWPSVVGLFVTDPYEGYEYFSCGGTLIDPSWVLTAAHCVVGEGPGDTIRPWDLKIKIGTQDLSAGGQMIRAAQIIVRPSFSYDRISDDVALVRLSRPSDRARPLEVASPTDIPWSGAALTTAGWGVSNYDTFESPVRLRQVGVPALSGVECQTALNEAAAEMGTPSYHSSHLCTGPIGSGGQGPCYGDSGGPLVWEKDGRKILVGVVSWGAYCASPETPSVFSKVASASRWIAQQIQYGPHVDGRDFAASVRYAYFGFDFTTEPTFPADPGEPGAYIAGLHQTPTVTRRDGSIVRLYQAILGRRAERHGFQYWRERMLFSDFGITRVAEVMAKSAEFKTTYGSLGDEDFVETLYQNVLGRAGAPADVDYWEGRLAGGESRGRIAALIAESAENKARTQAEVDVQVAFLSLVQRAPAAYEIDQWTTKPLADLGRFLVHSVAYARLWGGGYYEEF